MGGPVTDDREEQSVKATTCLFGSSSVGHA